MYREIELGFILKQDRMDLAGLRWANIISAPGVKMGLEELIEAMMWSHRMFLALAKYFSDAVYVTSESHFGMIVGLPVAYGWYNILLTDVWGRRTLLSTRMYGDYDDGRLEFTLDREGSWNMFYAHRQGTLLIPQTEARGWWIDFSSGLFVPNNNECLSPSDAVDYPNEGQVILMLGFPQSGDDLAKELLRRFRINGSQVFWFYYGESVPRLGDVRDIKRYVVSSYKVVLG